MSSALSGSDASAIRAAFNSRASASLTFTGYRRRRLWVRRHRRRPACIRRIRAAFVSLWRLRRTMRRLRFGAACRFALRLWCFAGRRDGAKALRRIAERLVLMFLILPAGRQSAG